MKKQSLLFIVLIIINSIAIFILFPESRYKLSIQRSVNGGDVVVAMYDDLDGDSVAEEIYARNFENVHTILNITSRNGFVSDLKLNGKIKAPEAVFFHDQDADGVKDIWSITRYQDTLRLNYSDLHQVQESHPITYTNPEYSLENYDYKVEIAGVCEGKLFFAINAGYPLTPRAVYSFDFETKEIQHTNDAGSLVLNPYFFDLDNDGTPEIITRSFAPENIHYDVTYTDSSSWLRIFDLDLNHMFKPIEYPYNTSKIFVFPIETDTERYLAVSSRYGGMKDVNPTISLVNSAGKIVRERELKESHILFQKQNKLLVLDDNEDSFFELNNELIKETRILELNSSIDTKHLISSLMDSTINPFVSIKNNVLSVIQKNFNEETNLVFDEPLLGMPSIFGNTIQVRTANKVYYVDLEEKSQLISWASMFVFLSIQAGGFIFYKQIKKIKNRKIDEKDYIIFKTGDQRLKVKFDEIEYLEAAGGPYTNVYLSTQERPLLIVRNIGAIEKELPERFVRISRRNVVNKNLIVSYSKTDIVLTLTQGEIRLPFTRKPLNSFY